MPGRREWHKEDKKEVLDKENKLGVKSALAQGSQYRNKTEITSINSRKFKFINKNNTMRLTQNNGPTVELKNLHDLQTFQYNLLSTD
jgi:hypothetical protein